MIYDTALHKGKLQDSALQSEALKHGNVMFFINFAIGERVIIIVICGKRFQEIAIWPYPLHLLPPYNQAHENDQ